MSETGAPLLKIGRFRSFGRRRNPSSSVVWRLAALTQAQECLAAITH
jgi:hypothetical protein